MLCSRPSFARKKEGLFEILHYFPVTFPADSACLWRLAKVSFIRFTTTRCSGDLAKLVYSLGSFSRSYNSAALASPHSA